MSTNGGVRADWATKDFYQVLGVAKDASADDIKKAYRKLARANHPDSNPGDTAKHDRFKAVAEAYDVIGDPEKRKKYDEMRAAHASGGFGFPQGGFNAGGRLRRERPASATGRGRRRARRHVRRPLRRRSRAGQPQRARTGAPTSRPRATIGFTDAVDGVTISLRLTSDAPCPTAPAPAASRAPSPTSAPSARARASWSCRPVARSR